MDQETIKEKVLEALVGTALYFDRLARAVGCTGTELQPALDALQAEGKIKFSLAEPARMFVPRKKGWQLTE